MRGLFNSSWLFFVYAQHVHMSVCLFINAMRLFNIQCGCAGSARAFFFAFSMLRGGSAALPRLPRRRFFRFAPVFARCRYCYAFSPGLLRRCILLPILSFSSDAAFAYFAWFLLIFHYIDAMPDIRCRFPDAARHLAIFHTRA